MANKSPSYASVNMAGCTSEDDKIDGEVPSTWKPIRASRAAMVITNPIRDIVDRLKLPKDPPKPLISLSIGDPTIFGNLLNPDNINEALIKNIQSRKFNGYAHSAGYESSRAAVARKHSVDPSPNSPGVQLTPNDVVITCGCSGALEIAITVLTNAGQNVLLPAPGFTLYQTICEHRGVEPRHYRLQPNKGWEVDLAHLESLIDDNTAAILVNNPSNPCGSVYSREHLSAILAVAEKHKLPIIADEIYGDMVFEGKKFYPIASLTKTVPVLSVGGIAKMYLVPGWRVGWVLVCDRNNLLDEVRIGLVKLSQLILGSNTLIQSVLEEALFNTPATYYQQLIKDIETNSQYLCKRLGKIDGMKIIEPGGAMYMMVGIDMSKFEGFKDDVEFAKLLLEEEMVFVLPGKIFKMPDYCRLVVTPPMDKLTEACDRIEAFCKRHSKQPAPQNHLGVPLEST